MGKVKEIKIADEKRFKIAVGLDSDIEQMLIQMLKIDLRSFAWTSSDMPNIDLDFLCHRLNVDPRSKVKVQRRRRLGEE